jgi:multiple sugar transport system substrate-binding protein
MNRREAILSMSGAAVTLAGCGRSSSKKQIKFWGVGREGDVAATLIRGFEQEHPDIEVNVQKMPFTAAHEKLLTAYAGDTLPDIGQLGNTWIPELAALDALEPLDGYVSASKQIPLEDYFDGILASNRLDRTLFGIPWYVDTRLLYYRKDLLRQAGFNEPPQTWQQWSDMLGAIKQMVGRDRYSILLPINEFEPLYVRARMGAAHDQHADFERLG